MSDDYKEVINEFAMFLIKVYTPQESQCFVVHRIHLFKVNELIIDTFFLCTNTKVLGYLEELEYSISIFYSVAFPRLSELCAGNRRSDSQ